jgi:UDP-N-acetylglucosamine 4,6-dehydratase/5-epimerase
MFKGQSVLLTGGTGFWGRKITEIALREWGLRKLIIFSRDELKQSEMHRKYNNESYPCMRYFIGDVRDRERLYRALEDVDIVIHLVGTNDLSSAEYNSFETVKTNIFGVMNLIDAAIDRNVKKVIALSCGMAVNPVHLQGITKLFVEKLLISGNNYSGQRDTRFSVVRLGSVLGDRNNFIHPLLKARETGVLTIQDVSTTRFLITLDQGISFLIKALGVMFGGEVFIPKMSSVNIADAVKAIAPECEINVVGNWPYETIHEVLLSKDEAIYTLEYDDYFSIIPIVLEKGEMVFLGPSAGNQCYSGFQYSSDSNKQRLTADELRNLIHTVESEMPA